MAELKVIKITARATHSLNEATGCFLEGDNLIRYSGQKLGH